MGLFTALYSERINWSFGDRLIELDVDGSCDYVSERWKELRQGVLSDESLTEEIDGLIHQVRDSGCLLYTSIWGVVWGALVFEEHITVMNVIGAAVIIAGILLVVSEEEK